MESVTHDTGRPQGSIEGESSPVALLFDGVDALLPLAEGLLGFPLDELPAAFGPPVSSGRHFRRSGTGYVAVPAGPAEESLLAGRCRRAAVRQAIADFPGEGARVLLQGLALATWAAATRFCAACGGALSEGRGEDSGGRVCAACGRTHFPRISPAVIVLVVRGDRMLLAHNARFPPDRFGLVAGFIEAGETAEEAAVREVREEAGIEIANLRYVRSQPWPFPDSLMLAFEADWAEGEARPDGVEITELRWCGRDDLPSLPPPGSVARSLIDLHLDRLSAGDGV